MTVNEILTEWSYKLNRGYPEMDNPYDILVLEQILKDSGFDSKDVNTTILCAHRRRCCLSSSITCNKQIQKAPTNMITLIIASDSMPL